MALRQPLYEQNDTTDQSADVVRLMLRDLMNERPGIVQANAMKAVQRSAGANNSVDIGSGAIIIPGTSVSNQGHYYVVNDATVNVPMSTPAHGSLPRIDTVIVAVRDQFYVGSNNDAQFVYVAGTAAASPSPPDIAVAGHNNYWRLANISVPANDNTITNAEITDVRTSATVIPAQGAATAVGGVIPCTSSSRPLLPREGQVIYEKNNTLFMFNRGSPDTPAWEPVIGAASKATRSTDQTINSGVVQNLTWTAASPNAFNMWSAGSPTRMTAPWRGYYGLSCSISWSSSNSGFFRRLTLYLNGSPEEGASVQLNNTADANPIRQNLSITGVLLSAGQFAEFRVTHDAGADRTIDFGISNVRMCYLGTAT